MILRQLLLLLVIVFFVWWAKQPLAAAQELKPTVKVDSPGRSVLSVPFQIAEEQGFYKDGGISASDKFIRERPDALTRFIGQPGVHSDYLKRTEKSPYRF